MCGVKITNYDLQNSLFVHKEEKIVNYFLIPSSFKNLPFFFRRNRLAKEANIIEEYLNEVHAFKYCQMDNAIKELIAFYKNQNITQLRE